MTKVVIYTDFDGTVTSRAGSKAVFTPFYQSLLVGYEEGKTQDYKRTPMKSVDAIQELFVTKFGEYTEQFDFNKPDADMLMAPSAVQFFHELLANDQVSINIVTRNRSEYVNALFKYQGFSDSEINKLTFMESGFKFEDVDRDLKVRDLRGQRPSSLYILDDARSDFLAMRDAARLNSYTDEQTKAFNKEPGQFEWNLYLDDVKADILRPEALIVEPNTEHQDSLTTEPSTSASSTQTTDVDLRVAGIFNLGTSTIQRSDEHAQSTPQQEITDGQNSTVVIQAHVSDEAPNNHPQPKSVLPDNTKTQQTPPLTSNSSPAKIMATMAGLGFSLAFIVGFALVASGVFAPFGLGLIGATILGAVLGAHTALITGVFGLIIDIARQPSPNAGPKLNTDNSIQSCSSIISLRGLGGKAPVSQSDAPVAHFPGVLLVEHSSKEYSTADQSTSPTLESFKPD
ncbi:Dot/Icm T4SS effector [Legionella moravica]|uniref:Dot/Icm T4SS effector n=1 Tax=Legionella moravica TaxID=39962 RepID=A0A378JRS6_9GAMM|nr:DUF2892 domain-containing protein [Legionella moravica]KTD39066.1 Dot/Icm T4SS effector [Legionella moravica]STX61136.1 Dot/Icm T4SS effector [Legionella moravica]